MAKRSKRRSVSSGRPRSADPLRSRAAVVAALALLFLLAGCAERDPRAEVLEERARWDVQILSWAPTESGSVNISARLGGPTSAKLRSLTVRFEMQDAGGALLGDQWHVFDLSDVSRGGPKDFSVVLADAPDGVEQLRLDRVYEPTPEQESRIRELQL